MKASSLSISLTDIISMRPVVTLQNLFLDLVGILGRVGRCEGADCCREGEEEKVLAHRDLAWLWMEFAVGIDLLESQRDLLKERKGTFGEVNQGN